MASVTSNFKERDLGGIVEELFRIYTRNFLSFLGIAAVCTIPLAIIGTALRWYAVPYVPPDTSELTILFIIIAILILASILASLLLPAAVTYAVATYYQDSRIAIGKAYEFAWHRLGSLLGVGFLAGLALFALCITIIGIPFAIYFGVAWAFIIQTVVLEQQGITRSLSRSSALVKNTWWRVLGVLIIIALIESILSSVAGGTVGFITVVLRELADILLIDVFSTLVASFVGMVFLPISLIGAVLLYFDLRIRKEGYSLETMARELRISDELSQKGTGPIL